MGRPIIRDRKSTDGILYYLDYTYNGVRHRPPLGKNLSVEQQTELALQEVKRIHNGSPATRITSTGCTFSQFLPTYWQAFRAKGRVDEVRPNVILTHHLTPRYGTKPLAEINDPAVGKDYITSRLKEGAAAGTVRREWQVLMRIINLAVRQDVLARNRLAAVSGDFMPEAVKRERSVERWELEALRDQGGKTDVWRAAVAAMHTGLREGKLLCHRDGGHVKSMEDGAWLYLAPARTASKGNPEVLPLNRFAVEALQEAFPWPSVGAFKQAWAAATHKAGIVDLHFHDLRHLFATTLDDLGVKDRYISMLLGHKVKGMTGRYIRKNLRHLRDAVTRLELAFDPNNLSVDLPAQVHTLTQIGAEHESCASV